jgi:VWFA-related protein
MCGAAKMSAFIAVAVLVLAEHANPQASPESATQDSDSYKFSVNVDLVVVYATVRDRGGHLVTGLSQDEFAVYEDGVRQQIRLFRREDIPVTVGLVIDHSGSMRSKLSDVIAAARAFVQSSNRDDEMFIVNFNEFVSLGLPDSIPFINNPDTLERAISKTPAEGQTALYDAVGLALNRVRTGSRDKRVLVLISDGGDNKSVSTQAEVLKMAGLSNTIIYTIGIFDDEDEDSNPQLLKRLAAATGGEAYFPARYDETVAICSRIAKDIRNQYAIGYTSTNAARNGSFRAVRVSAGSPRLGKLIVRARTGYVAGSELPAAVAEVAK